MSCSKESTPVKRILITGKTSWIGDELERHLQNFPNAYVVERYCYSRYLTR